MKCPKCGGTLRNDMYCEHCNEYLFNMDKSAKGEAVFSWLKIFGITVGAFAVIMGLIVGIISIQSNNAEKEQMITKYDEIVAAYEEGDYFDALSSIETFNHEYAEKDKTLTAKTEAISVQIEEKLFTEISSKNENKEIETACNKYLDYFPKGKYKETVNTLLTETEKKLAPQRIKDAKQAIDEDDILEADRLLKLVMDGTASSEDKNEAKKIAESISYLVDLETTKYVSITDLLADAANYNFQNISIEEKLRVADIDRERKMLITFPEKDSSFTSSNAIEIHYGKLSDMKRWGSISLTDEITISVSGRFKLYANRSNSGYVEADSITKAY